MAERLEDLNLPNASVQKIIKDALPESVSIGKDARTALARAASVFVLYITSHAVQQAQQVKRRTLWGQDVIEALKNLEFDNLVEPLMEHLNEYKGAQKVKKGKIKSKKSSEESCKDPMAELEDEDEEDEVDEEK